MSRFNSSLIILSWNKDDYTGIDGSVPRVKFFSRETYNFNQENAGVSFSMIKQATLGGKI